MAATYIIIPVPPPPSCPDEAYAETSPLATGDTEILDSGSQPIAGYNQFSALADLTSVDYKITVDGVGVEWGIANYDAKNDKLFRAPQYSLVGTGVPDPIPGGVQTVIGRGSVSSLVTQVIQAADFSLLDTNRFARVMQEGCAYMKMGNTIKIVDGVLVSQFPKQSNLISIVIKRPGANFVGIGEFFLNAQGWQAFMNASASPAARESLTTWPLIRDAGVATATDLIGEGDLVFAWNDTILIERAAHFTPGGTNSIGQTIEGTLENHTKTLKGIFKDELANGTARFGTVADKHQLMRCERIYGVTVPTGTVFQSAPITRIAGASQLIQAAKVAGQTGVIALTAYMVLKDLAQQIADRYSVQVVQGRLQHNTKIAQTDADRVGVGNTLYFAPTYQREPRAARVSLFYPPGIITGEFLNKPIHHSIVTTSGDCPSLRFDTVCQKPFGVDASKLPSAFSSLNDGDGIPADVFMYWPAQPNFQGASDAEPNVPSSRSKLPRMFYLNWHSATSRNNGEPLGPARRGFDLVNTDELGLCLNAKTVAQGGFIHNFDSLIAVPRLYLYLGTVAMYAGDVTCAPGCRTLWNNYNRLAYDDFTSMNPQLERFNREATQAYLAYFSLGRTYCSHIFLDPTDGSNQLPGISNQALGRFSTTIIGPLSVRVIHKAQVNVIIYKGAGTDPAYQEGVLNCSPVNVEMTNLHLPAAVQGPGLHEIACYQGLALDVDCRHKRYTFVNSKFDNYWWSENFGYSPDENSFGEPTVALAPDDCMGKTRGFGFAMTGGC